jgi:hypothetical protein
MHDEMSEQEWTWLLQATSGPIGQAKQFYEGTAQTEQELVNIFRLFLSPEQPYKELGSFTLNVSHRAGRQYTSTSYFVSSTRGYELWGDDRSMQTIEHAWQEAGGISRHYPQRHSHKGVSRVKRPRT